MKKILALIAFSLAFCGYLSAQSFVPELDKIKQIVFLETSRDEVNKLFAADTVVSYARADDFEDYFYTNNANISVYYSKGNCAKEFEEVWNAPKWTVTAINISSKNEVWLKDIGIDYSKFRKEQMYRSRKERFVYINKKAGISIYTKYDEVTSISFYPSEKDYFRLCDGEEVKKYYASPKWRIYPESKNRIVDIFDENADIVGLDLSKAEIILDCISNDSSQNKNCSEDSQKIAVSTTAIDRDHDTLVYEYYVSSGKIVGTGANVVWDLSGVKAGTYKITATADDGCGPCGKFLTKTVTVKECPDCLPK